jgi:hypothetical protein
MSQLKHNGFDGTGGSRIGRLTHLRHKPPTGLKGMDLPSSPSAGEADR